MYAIYKGELKNYFNSQIAYIIIGLFILLTSIFFTIGNIYNPSTDIAGLLGNMGTFLLFIVPILTMKSIAEDRKNGLEVLFVTSPNRLSGIVIGKYLAALTVYLVITGISLMYPVILFLYSSPALLPLVGGYLGFILLGASLISVGIFASSLSENQVVAAIISFTALLIMMMAQPVGNVAGGLLSKVLNGFSVFSRYDDFSRGIFSLNSLIYYLSFIFLFIFLAIRVIEKRRWSTLRLSANSIISMIAVVAIIVSVNLFAELRPIKWDFTANKLYTLGDATKKTLDRLDENVTIYGLFDDGKIDTDYKEVKNLLDRYESYSKSHITVKYIDPDKDPDIISQLDPKGDKGLKKTDFVITGNGKSKILTYENIFQTELDQRSFSRYNTGSLAEQGFTGAVKYVAARATPAVYFTEGHREGDPEVQFKTLKEYLGKNNYIVKTVNLIKEAAVPDDAGVLIFASPQSDLSAEEGKKLETFLQKGGNAVFLFDYIASNPSLPQFESIIKSYGVSLNYDKVKESDEEKYQPNDPFALIIDVTANHIVPIEFQLVIKDARSIRILKNDDKANKITSLLNTGDTASGLIIGGSGEQPVQGPLELAAASERQTKNYISRILVMGDSTLLNESSKKQQSAYFSSALYYFINVLNWMQNTKDEAAIGPKEYNTQTLKISQHEANVVSVIVLAAVPLIILGFGVDVWLRRRHL
jgi:ABC-2 type transport system permease protein